MFGRLKPLTVSCPACGHEQEEPQFARSTFCRERGCGAYFQIADGQAVPTPPPAEYPFPLRDKLASEKAGPKAARASRINREKALPPRTTQLEFFSAQNRTLGPFSAVPSKARIPRVAHGFDVNLGVWELCYSGVMSPVIDYLDDLVCRKA